MVVQGEGLAGSVRQRLSVLWIDWDPGDSSGIDAFSRHAEVLRLTPSLTALNRLDVDAVAAGVFDVDRADSLDSVKRFKTLAPAVPVLLVASEPGEALLLWALRAGVRDVLEKPLSGREVMRVLDELRRLVSLRDARRTRRDAVSRGSGNSDDQVLPGATGKFRRDEIVAARIRSYVSRHLHEALRVEDIALACHCTPATCCSISKKMLGCTLQTFVVKERIRRAAKLLSRTSAPVASIAWQVGFHDTAYFCRTFRRFVGRSPSAYRGHPGPDIAPLCEAPDEGCASFDGPLPVY